MSNYDLNDFSERSAEDLEKADKAMTKDVVDWYENNVPSEPREGEQPNFTAAELQELKESI